VSSRGVEDRSSSTVTSHYGGKFAEEARKQEFMNYIYNK
jgi:GTP cyclohydrolase I